MISSYFCTLAVLNVALALPLNNPLDNGTSLDNNNGTSPDSTSSNQTSVAFAADPSINVEAIYAAAQAAKSPILASYPINEGKNASISNIYGNWLNLTGVSALQFIADMDVDCDGADSNCPHATTNESTTAWGHLDASKVPYIVIPDEFSSPDLKPNSLTAVICDGKMYYAIFGDTNGDGVTTEITGEGSILLAQTCFPTAGISGDVGHDPNDVAYIVFGTQVPSGVGDETIDIDALKTLGDQQVKLLETALNISAGYSGASNASSMAPISSNTARSTTPHSRTRTSDTASATPQ